MRTQLLTLSLIAISAVCIAAPPDDPTHATGPELVLEMGMDQELQMQFPLRAHDQLVLVTYDKPPTTYQLVDHVAAAGTIAYLHDAGDGGTEVLMAGCCDQGYGTGRYWVGVLALLSLVALSWKLIRRRQPA